MYKVNYKEYRYNTDSKIPEKENRGNIISIIKDSILSGVYAFHVFRDGEKIATIDGFNDRAYFQDQTLLKEYAAACQTENIWEKFNIEYCIFDSEAEEFNFNGRFAESFGLSYIK